MTAMSYVAEWAIRSSILVAAGALLVYGLRTRDALARWAAWTAMLCGSLALPVLSLILPGVHVGIPQRLEKPARVVAGPVRPALPILPSVATGEVRAPAPQVARTARALRWDEVFAGLYVLISAILLLRVSAGFVLGSRTLRYSRGTELRGVRESERLHAPATAGIFRPSIVLPAGWRAWDSLKLEAVLAHERSHAARRDPAVQLLSAIHRAILWVSPLSWFLHQSLIRAAEEASDDAAVMATRDRTAYAEILLDFMRQAIGNAAGVSMARYGNPEQRIRRILDASPPCRISRRSIVVMLGLGSPIVFVIASAQPQNLTHSQTFENVEIRAAAPNTMPQMRSRFGNGRYELHNATAVDLIRAAWGVEADDISGGPDWLDLNRYDVIATAPATATPEMLRTMLQGLLKDRFQLSVRNGKRNGKRNNPAYTVVAAGRPKLMRGEGTEPGGCKFDPVATVPRGAPLPQMTLVCGNLTIPAFLKMLSRTQEATGYLFDYPLLDRTGLTGVWNFRLTWSPRRDYVWSPTPTDAITLFDAFEKQLGLKLEFSKVARPVLVVEKASPPRVTNAPKPRMEFEVAEIKPVDPNAPPAPCGVVAIQPGGRVRINMTLRNLIWEAWGAPFDFSRFIGGPKEGMDSPCWQILAKAPVEQNALGTPNPAGWNGAIWNGVDLDTMRMSLRSLLEDRFQLSAHLEDRMIDGYAMTAAGPKLKKANPANRPGCKEGPGDDGTDPRLSNPRITRLITCRDMTLAQFAAQLNDLFPGSPPMTDATGIPGRFDMTIGFSPSGLVQAAPDTSGEPPEPTGAISLFDALRGQLGLKVAKRKVPAPVLIVDRVNETPTEN